MVLGGGELEADEELGVEGAEPQGGLLVARLRSRLLGLSMRE